MVASRHRRAWCHDIGGLGFAAVAVAVAVVAVAGPAAAATLDGTATIVSPSDVPVTSGGSTTQFSIALPANSVCSGDTATDGYHVYSYLVQVGTSITGISFTSHPSEGLGLVNNTGVYYGPVNTAITTGQIISVPSNFEFAPLLTDGASLSTLLYSGTSGVWDAGLACANSSGVLTDYWNTEVTFSASDSDSDGFVWSVGPPAATPEVPVALLLPVAGAAVLGGGVWGARRRARRRVMASATASS